MTDDIKAKEAEKADKKTEEKLPQTQTDEKQTDAKNETAPTEVETRATEIGWTPKEEFKGDPAKWVDAKTWVDRTELFEHPEFRKLRRKAKDLEGTVGQLKSHYEKVEQNAYARAVASLKQEKLAALEEGDHKRVLAVDDELDKLRDSKPAPIQNNGADPAFLRWNNENPWYESDPDLHEYADFSGVRYARENPEKTSEEIFEYAARQTRKQFPEKFRNTNREKPSNVEGGRASPGKSGQPRWSDMPAHYQQAGQKFVNQGIMTREQYMQDLIKIGELK